MIIACGTATSQSLDIVKEEFDIPIIGIIEPTVQYVKEKQIKKIGVIATTGTIRSKEWEKSLKSKINEIEVISKACPLLASIAEEGKIREPKSIETINGYMEKFKREKVNTIILGCTHYPLYDQIIKDQFETKVNLINVGTSVANYVKKYMEENKIENGKNKNEKSKTYKDKTEKILSENLKPTTKIIITKEEFEFEKNAKNILKSTRTLDITNIN